MTGDEYLHAQLQPILQPGEQVLQTAYMRRQPGLLVQMLLIGGLLLYLMTKAYFAVLTNRRLILIRTKMGFWKGGPQQQNLGVEEYDARNLKQCSTSGFANNRSMTFTMHQGPSQTLRISPWFKSVTGTKQFLEQVPNLINSGQLAQLTSGQQPQLPAGPMPSAAGFQPGQPVLVAAQDGNRYPATVIQVANGQYLCQMPNGQPYWFPAQVVMPHGR